MYGEVRIRLSDHFTYRRLIRFTLPSVCMMVFTSIYSVVDGFFVSNYAGKNSLVAVNLIMPLFIILGTIGFMLGTGGNAIVARTLGEGDKERARRYFSFLVYACIAFGLLIVLLGQIFIRRVAVFFGAEGAILDLSLAYGRILLAGMPFFMLQNLFQSFCVTAEKPHLGLSFTLASGFANMVLDWLFVGALGWGIRGAAWATIISEMIGGLGPLVYFLLPNSSLLRLGRCGWYPRVLGGALSNGSSELMSNIAASVITVAYNKQLLRYAGTDGVAAFGVLSYVMFFFLAIFIGYGSLGVVSLVGYNYGAANTKELRNIFRKSLVLTAWAALAMFLVSFLGAPFFARMFVGYSPSLVALATHAMRIYGLGYLAAGFAIFSSAFFTALGNGLVSAIISTFRTLVMELLCVFLLPLFFGLEGIWWSWVVAELGALMLSLVFLLSLRKTYGY